MGIPHVTLDLRERFRSTVVDEFLDGYAAGRTPNPCVRCNGEVRFDAMLALADALGAARLATGHYARIARDEQGPLLRAGADPRKDQSYMLARLEPAQLERLSFPLGGLTKDCGARAGARGRACPWPTGARARTCASPPASAAKAFLRRHGPGRAAALRADRGRRRARARPPRRPARVHRRPAPRPRRGERAEPLYVLAKDARTATVTVGPREALAVTQVRLERPLLHRGVDGVEAARLRYGSRRDPLPRGRGRGRRARARAVAPRRGGGARAAGLPARRATGSPAMGRSRTHGDDRQGADRPRRAALGRLPAGDQADHRRASRSGWTSRSRRSTTSSWPWSGCWPRPGRATPSS